MNRNKKVLQPKVHRWVNGVVRRDLARELRDVYSILKPADMSISVNHTRAPPLCRTCPRWTEFFDWMGDLLSWWFTPPKSIHFWTIFRKAFWKRIKREKDKMNWKCVLLVICAVNSQHHCVDQVLLVVSHELWLSEATRWLPIKTDYCNIPGLEGLTLKTCRLSARFRLLCCSTCHYHRRSLILTRVKRLEKRYPRLGETYCRRKPRYLYQALMCGRLLLREPDLSRVIDWFGNKIKKGGSLF